MITMFRDTFASLMGHTDLTNHLAICENEYKARVKFRLEKMLQPCGPPPEKKQEDRGEYSRAMAFDFFLLLLEDE